MTSNYADAIARALLVGPRTPHYSAIGEFLVEFSQLEYFVKTIYFLAIEAKDDSYDVVTTQPIRSLINGISEIQQRRFGPTAAAPLLAVLKRVQAVADERNHIAHAHWQDDTAGLVATFVSNHKLRPAAKYQSVAQIEAETKKVRQLTEEILDAFVEVNRTTAT